MSNEKVITVFLHEIKLSGNDDFTQRFNVVSDLYGTYNKLPDGPEKNKAWDEYFQAKLALEQGYAIPG